MTWKSIVARARGVGFSSAVVIMAFNFAITCAMFFATNEPIEMRLTNNLQPFNPPEIARDFSVSAWLPSGFGMRSPGYNMGILFIYFVQMVFHDPWTSQFVFIFAPFWLSSVAMYLLLREGGISSSRSVLIIASLVYAYNWLTLQYIGNHMMMYTYAAFPLVILSIIRIFLREGFWLLNALLLAVTFFLGTMFYTVAGICFMLPFFFVGFIFWVIWPGKSIRGVLTSLVTIALGFIIYVALSFPFTLPVLMEVLKLGVSGYAASAKFVVWSHDFLAYLQPYYFDSYLPSRVSPMFVLTSPSASGLSAVGGLLIFLVATLSLMSPKKRDRMMSIALWTSFLLVALMVALIRLRSPFVEVIYSSLPFIWPINSADIYLLILAGLLSLLFALGLEAIMLWRNSLTRVHWKHLRTLTVACYLIGMTVISSTVVLSHNAALLRPVVISNGEIGSTYPLYIRELADAFNEERRSEGPFRVLWVPQSHRINILMQSNDVYSDFSPSGLEPELHQKIELLADAIRNYLTYDIGRQLALLGYRYVVVLRHASDEGPVRISEGVIDTYLTGDPANFEQPLDEARDIKLVNRTQSYSLYRNNGVPPNWHGLLWATNSNYTLLGTSPSFNLEELKLLEMSPTYAATRYLVEVSAPSWLVFLQNYDSGWNAYVYADGKRGTQLEHVKVLDWANAFHITGVGTTRVLLIYEPQADRDRLLLAWIIVGGLAIASPILYHVGVKASKGKSYDIRRLIRFGRRTIARMLAYKRSRGC